MPDGSEFHQASGYICGISVIVTQCGTYDYSIWDSANEKPVLVFVDSLDEAIDEAYRLTLDTMMVFLRNQNTPKGKVPCNTCGGFW